MQLGWTVLQVLMLHFILLMGLERKVPLLDRLVSYPAQVLGLVQPAVFSQVAPEVLLTGVYLLGGLGLAWFAVTLFSRWARPVLWFLEGVPSFLLLVLGVWVGVTFTVARNLDFPLAAWSPVMLTLYSAALALPAAARVALATGLAEHDALKADFTRTARAMGWPEWRVRRQAQRVAFPERAASLAGDAVPFALALIVMEGILDFPGLGNTIYGALGGVLSGTGDIVGSATPDNRLPQQLVSAALLLWLMLGHLFALGFRWLATRLDPRLRTGQEVP